MTARFSFKHGIGFLAMVAAWGPAVTALAQEEILPPTLTSVSAPMAVRLSKEGAVKDVKSLTDSETRTLDGVLVEVAADQQAMIYSSSGQVALVAIGPAKFNVRLGENRVDFDVLAGRLMATTQTPAEEQVVHLMASVEGGDPLFDSVAGPGWLYLMRDGNTVDVAYQSDQSAAGLKALLEGKEIDLAAGQRITLRDGKILPSTIGAWPSEVGFEKLLGQRLGVASAAMSRYAIQGQFAANIIKWDQRAVSKVVIAAMPQQTFRPEIRQTAVTISTTIVTPTLSTSAQTPQPALFAQNFPNLVSPAGSSLGGIGNASALQQNANTVLVNTQNRGFGFFTSPSTLAIPGQSGGSRTVGPAGLGAP